MRTLKKGVACVATLLLVLLGLASTGLAPTEKELPPPPDLWHDKVFVKFDEMLWLAAYERDDRQNPENFVSKPIEEREARIRRIVSEFAQENQLDESSALMVMGPYAVEYLVSKGVSKDTEWAKMKLGLHISFRFFWEDYNAELKRVAVKQRYG